MEPHRQEILRTAARHRATHVRVFGSVRRGDATAASDLDLLVRMKPGASVLDQIALARELEARLKRRVDVVNDESIYWYAEPQIRAEAIPL
ncbi:MAG: nucleotidyltransferase domain-containing protein [Thermoplasmata archaeon]